MANWLLLGSNDNDVETIVVGPLHHVVIEGERITVIDPNERSVVIATRSKAGVVPSWGRAGYAYGRWKMNSGFEFDEVNVCDQDGGSPWPEFDALSLDQL
jgi:hypothetical protein